MLVLPLILAVFVADAGVSPEVQSAPAVADSQPGERDLVLVGTKFAAPLVSHREG
jgi:hypothetical protein